MKRSFRPIVVLSAGFLILGSGIQMSAAEPGQTILVRNALDQAVRLEITNGQSLQALEIATVRPRWQVNVAAVKAEDLASGLQVSAADKGQTGPELARCEMAFTKTSDPRIAVIVHKQIDSGSPRCDIVDLNAFQPIAKASSVPNSIIGAIALKS